MSICAKAQFLLGEGRHDAKVFSTDRAGRRSAIRTRLYQVNPSKPVVAARTMTPEPSRGRWFRAEPRGGSGQPRGACP